MRFYVNSLLFLTWMALFELGYRWSELFYGVICLVQFFFLYKFGKFKLNYFLVVVSVFSFFTLLVYPSVFVAKFLLIYITLLLTLIGPGDLNFKSVRIINYCIFISFLISCLNKIVDFNVAWSSLLTSDFSSLENNSHPFLFLIFGLFYLVRRQFWMSALNFVFIILSFKRIVVIAFIVSVPVIFFRWYGANFFKLMLRLLPFGFLAIPFILISETADEVVYENTGLYLSHITQGRSSFYDGIINEFYSWSTFLVGHGSGRVTDWSIKTFDYLIHNDFLKIFLEFGLIGFITIFALLRRAVHPAFYFALLLLFSTDNVFVYIYIFYFIFNLNCLFEKED